uniref:Purple acid phosphatase n=1 Tax=Kalanchoe fedtschenkoi TaxID=63787 RepID=A0A7N0TRJ3_KALFE
MADFRRPVSFYVVVFVFTWASLHLSITVATPGISVSPKVLQKSGDSVHVEWSGVESPSHLDWLGIYSPSDSQHDHFIGYIFLNSSPAWPSGSGRVSFPLVNLRSDYAFRIFRWTDSEVDYTRLDSDHNPLPGTKHLLAESGRVGFEPGRGPEQVHLGFTEREDEMRVMFVTGDGSESFVRFGRKEEEMGFVTRTAVARYVQEDLCHAPANDTVGWRDAGYVHDGVMKRLRKGKRYFYKVGSDAAGWSSTFSFVSRNGDSDETVAFLFGDMGTAVPYNTFLRTQDESTATVKWILRDMAALGDKPAFVSHIGDISYARGYSWLWDNFFHQIQPVASRLPYHVCIGNHEYDWPAQPWKPDWAAKIYGTDGGGECGVPYSVKFNMPGNFSEPTGTRAPATRNLYYSFNTGSVHFLYISTETNFLPGSGQYEFIKRDLESVDRKRTPFIVVQGHRPMYTTSSGKKDDPLRQKMVEHLEPLLVENSVNMAFWGHVHRYERFCPLNNFTCGVMDGASSKGYIVHVVIGMGGQDWQPVWEPRSDHPLDPVYPQPERSLFRAGEFGYTRIYATKDKLTFTYVGNHDGKVHDMVEILASGQVLDRYDAYKFAMEKIADSESALAWYVKVASFLALGAFLGYVFGFISQVKRLEAAGPFRWTPLKVRASQTSGSPFADPPRTHSRMKKNVYP